MLPRPIRVKRLIKKFKWHGRFQLSTEAVASFDYRFMFRKELGPLVERINAHLRTLQADGTLDAIIAKYR